MRTTPVPRAWPSTERDTHRSDADETGTGTHRHAGDLADHETDTEHPAEKTTTVTHPDGSAETVSAPDANTTNGGTHRA